MPHTRLDTLIEIVSRRLAVVVCTVVLAGCAAIEPTGEPPPSSTSVTAPSGSPGASMPASVAPPSVVVDSNSMPAGFVLQQGTFPTADTTPLQDQKTDGSVIFWSTGVDAAPDTAPDLWAAPPGGTPERIFANPNRDSALLPIAGWGGRYAFVESNPRLYGLNGWRLWYLDHVGATPVLLDASDGPSPLPLLAMTADRLAWGAFHGPAGHATSELLTVTLPDLTKRVVERAPSTKLQYVFPCLLGSELAFGVEDPVIGAEHVDLLDLATTGAPARQVDTSGDATMPVLTGGSVLWKEGANIFSSGQLVRHLLPDGPTTELAFGTWSGVLYPSAGRRFVTAWGWDTTQFYMLDLTTNQAVLLEGFPSTGPLNDVRPYIAGDLLVWSRGVSTLDAQGGPTQPLELNWARLAP